MKVHLRVPATTANLGPGFDSLGLALNLYIELVMSSGNDTDSVELLGEMDGIGTEPSNNLIMRASSLVFERARKRPEGLMLKIFNSIPIGKGLGSSASAIVAGMFAANRLIGDPFTRDELMDMAADMEGHPDNVVPAVVGGLTASMISGGKVYYHRLDPGSDLKIVVAVPDFDLPTKTARAVLPEQISRTDFIDGIQKTSFLLMGLIIRDYSNIKMALEKILFQEIRSTFIPGYSKIVEKACEAGALGVTLSGAGPSLAAFTLVNESEICHAMSQAFKLEGIESRCYILSPETEGVSFIDRRSAMI